MAFPYDVKEYLYAFSKMVVN